MHAKVEVYSIYYKGRYWGFVLYSEKRRRVAEY